MDSRKLSIIILVLLLAFALSASALHPILSSGLGTSAGDTAPVKPAKALSAPAPDYSNWTLMAFNSCENYYGYCRGTYEISIGPYGGKYEPFSANTGNDDRGPVLYPGGDKIVWSQGWSGFGTIYIANRDGSNVIQLGQDNAYEHYPAFSPDGSKIAFTKFFSTGVYLMNSDGTGETLLAAGCTRPDWSPDGSRIVMNCAGGIYTINPDGSNLVQLTNPVDRGYPIWSPNGTWIAYHNDSNLWRMDAADGGNKIMLYDFTKGNVYPCDWSPDSRMVAFIAATYVCTPEWGCETDTLTLKVLDSANGHVTSITNSQSLVEDCSWVSMDLAAPSSAVDPLPATSRSKFTVRWSGIDPGNSGIEWYEVQVRDGEVGEWEPLTGPTSSISISFKGQAGHTYYFRSRAGDLAGNIEDYPDTPDAWTTVTR